jgi:hypothetical protein
MNAHLTDCTIDLAIAAQALAIELALFDLARDGQPGIPNSSLPGPSCASARAERGARSVDWYSDDTILSRGQAVPILKSPPPGAFPILVMMTPSACLRPIQLYEE